MNLPRARRSDVLTTSLDDEVVVYDPERKQAHTLNRVAVAVWSHADGTKTIEEVQRLASDEIGIPVDQEAVWLALRKLERAHLLMEKLGRGGPITRREALVKGGRAGAVAMVTPLIASALVPTAAAAASVCSAFVCNVTPFVDCSSSGTGRCLCITTTEGNTVCTGDFTCGTTQACATSADCTLVAGSVCQAAGSGCCGFGVCAPLCPPGAAPSTPLSGPTNSGR